MSGPSDAPALQALDLHRGMIMLDMEARKARARHSPLDGAPRAPQVKGTPGSSCSGRRGAHAELQRSGSASPDASASTRTTAPLPPERRAQGPTSAKGLLDVVRASESLRLRSLRNWSPASGQFGACNDSHGFRTANGEESDMKPTALMYRTCTVFFSSRDLRHGSLTAQCHGSKKRVWRNC